jgi:hypothetical protein
MRTSINLAEDVHEFAKLYANARGITLSAAISELIRKGQTAERATPKAPAFRRSSAGFPLFPRTGDKLTTSMVRKAEEDDLD